MITFLRGKIEYLNATEIGVNCNGTGYGVAVSTRTSQSIGKVGDEIKILTYLVHREDAMLLFGFNSEEEKQFFLMLIEIQGIGPKTALGILSTLSIEELLNCIANSDLRSLQKLPGIGKKTAERLVVELRDKVAKIQNITISTSTIEQRQFDKVSEEAISAMITLGYSKLIAEKSIKIAKDEFKNNDYDIQKLITKALSVAMKN